MTKRQASWTLTGLLTLLVALNTVILPQIAYFVDLPYFLIEYAVGGVIGLALGDTLGPPQIDAITTFLSML